jgi:hypothetical protein
MENNCSKRPTNFKEFIRSSWFKKPLQIIALGATLGLLLYFFWGDSPYTNNIYGDMLGGIFIGLFLIEIPCMTCNSRKNNN